MQVRQKGNYNDEKEDNSCNSDSSACCIGSACSSKAAETTAAEAETIQAISAETVPETEESSSEAAATEESESESNSVSDTSAAETTAAAASSVDEAALKLYQDAMAKTAAAGAMDTTTKMELTTNDQSVSIDMQMIHGSERRRWKAGGEGNTRFERRIHGCGILLHRRFLLYERNGTEGEGCFYLCGGSGRL